MKISPYIKVILLKTDYIHSYFSYGCLTGLLALTLVFLRCNFSIAGILLKYKLDYCIPQSKSLTNFLFYHPMDSMLLEVLMLEKEAVWSLWQGSAGESNAVIWDSGAKPCHS